MLSAALAESCAVRQMETQDPILGKNAGEALSAAFGIINRYAHMTSNAFLQFAVARASLAVGVATKSRQEFDRALEALDRVLEIWTFTPYTSNHIQATYTKALTLSSLAFFPQRHEGFDRLEREGTAMNSPLGDLIKNVAQDAHRQRDLLDQAVRLRTLREAVENLEKLAQDEKFLKNTKMASWTARMLMSLTGRTSQDMEEFFLKGVGR